MVKEFQATVGLKNTTNTLKLSELIKGALRLCVTLITTLGPLTFATLNLSTEQAQAFQKTDGKTSQALSPTLKIAQAKRKPRVGEDCTTKGDPGIYRHVNSSPSSDIVCVERTDLGDTEGASGGVPGIVSPTIQQEDHVCNLLDKVGATASYSILAQNCPQKRQRGL